MKVFTRLTLGAALLALMVGTGHSGPVDDVRFGVFSDPHYYDTDLGLTGSAFEAYLAVDRKMLRESNAILDAALLRLANENLDFVIVPGDLTKDGEKSGHEKFAAKLAGLEALGIDVYVVPGNHDILNPHAVSFSGDTMTPVPTVTPGEFEDIYEDFGYAEAVMRDPNSLSYVAEPAAGLWLLALDTCRYDNNMTDGYPETGGGYSAETMAWALEMIRTAKNNHKRIIAMQHHGLLEHYTGQTVFIFGDYVVDNWVADSERLAKAGLEIVFTGHFHSHDAVAKILPTGEKIMDVETGSLVTYPVPYRVCEMDREGLIEIESRAITQVAYDTSPKSFSEHAFDFLHDGMIDLVTYYLTLPVDQGGFGMDPGDANTAFVAGLGADAYAAHYAGDEDPPAQVLQIIGGLMASQDTMEQLLGQMLGSIWSDLPPGDAELDQTLAEEGTPFELGQKLAGELDGFQDSDAFDVYLTKGTKVKVQAYAHKRKGLAPNLTVFAPDGSVVLDLVSTKKMAKDELVADESGLYRLVVDAGTVDRTGNYGVKVKGKMNLPPYTAKKVDLSDPTMVFPPLSEDAFSIPDGATVKVVSAGHAKKKTDRLVPIVRAVLPSGETGESGRKFRVEVSRSGRYRLQVSADDTSPVATGEFTLKMKCAWKKAKGTVLER